MAHRESQQQHQQQQHQQHQQQQQQQQRDATDNKFDSKNLRKQDIFSQAVASAEIEEFATDTGSKLMQLAIPNRIGLSHSKSNNFIVWIQSNSKSEDEIGFWLKDDDDKRDQKQQQ